jgi:2',3'-cyclic-nucleotide 2'-phosphodiesterase
MKILYFGDVVGKPGRQALKLRAQALAASEGADLLVANCENSSGGIGVDPGSARDLFSAGIHVLTSGNHIWHRREIYDFLEGSERLLRPANFAPGVPGRGWSIYETPKGPIAVVNLIGRVFMAPADCPFRAADAILEHIGDRARVVLVDMHAEATSEKMGMGRYLDGRVSAVVGSHTHVQTADEMVLPKGTAFITDTGMCGPLDSVIGMRIDQVLKRFVDQLPIRYDVGVGPPLLQAVAIDVDENTGRARGIRRIREVLEGAA